MRADGIFHKPPPPDRISEGVGEGPRGKGVDQGVVPENQLRAASALALFPPREQFQAARQKGRFEEPQVMCQGRRVPGVMELAEHLGIGDELGRKGCRQSEKMAQQNRFGDLAHLEHIAGKDRFDEGIGDVALPGQFVVCEGCGSGIAAEIDPLLQTPAEGGAALRIPPVVAAMQEKSAGQALGQPLLHQQG